MAKYASVYARKRSPFWWISYWDPKKRKRVHEATPYRLDAPQSSAHLGQLSRNSRDGVAQLGDTTALAGLSVWFALNVKEIEHRFSAEQIPDLLPVDIGLPLPWAAVSGDDEDFGVWLP